MPRKSEAPHDGGASRNSCGGCFRENLNPIALQAQFLISAYNIRPELAPMLAGAIFGGAHG
jgi:hypothetical protein